MLIWALGTLTHRLEGANAKSIASPLLAAPRSARNGTAAAFITWSPSSAVSEAAKLKGRAHPHETSAARYVTARYVRRAAHGYEPTREAAMAAFAKSWLRE
jgi:hypothetical protein